MAVLNAPIFDFKSGILTRKLLNRNNLELVKSGLLQGQNFITQVQGGQEFREGFKYVKLTRNNLPAVFWPFVFNSSQAFVLEFTDYKLRFYSSEGAIVEAAKTITGATKASPGVITIASHGYASGDEIYIDDVGGMEELNGRFFKVVYINANTFSLTDIDGNAINTTAYTTYTSGGTAQRVYEISTPYTQVEAENLMFDGTADVRYLVDGVHMPRKLVRNSNTDWSLSTYSRTDDPFEQKAITGASQANPGVITAVGHGYTTGDVVFIEDITGMTQLNNRAFTITVLTVDTFSLDGENTSAYTAYVSGGVVSLSGAAPRAVGLYGAALFFGGADNDPEVFHKSRQPDPTTGASRYDDFTIGTDPEDAVTLPLANLGEVVPRIEFFVGTRAFLATGMQGGMSKINGGADSRPITNTDIGTFPVDAVGVARIRPVTFGNDILYVQRGSEFLLSFRYSLANDGFESFDTMVQCDEISSSGIRQLAARQGKPNTVLALMNNGELGSLTYQRAENVTAWNTIKVGGAVGADVGVISICAEPQSTNRDRLWICVKRLVDGVYRYMVEVSADNPEIPEPEYFFTDFDAEEDDRQMYLNRLWEVQRRLVHMDGALIKDQTQTTTLTPGATTGDGVTFTAGASIFKSTDVGRYIFPKYVVGDEQGIAVITEYTSATQVKCQILSAFANTSAIPSGSWYLTVSTISNLEHLEGAEVTVLEDGAVASTKTVTNGAITLDDNTCVGIVGFGYVGILETMPIELLLSTGVTIGKYKTIGLFKAMFRHTLGASYGRNIYDLKSIKYRRGSDIGGRPTPLFTGMTDLPGFDDYALKKTYKIVQSKPLPCTVLGLVLDMEVPFE